MRATYSPEDNKLRLYAHSRLDADEYQRVKAAGFKWAPKQELFVAPSWSPDREDLLLDLCGEIEDEDYSPEERAADRAERFEGYRDKREAEADGFADRFDAGPSVFGHQSQRRAERQAARHDRLRGRACSQWSKAEYWQQRTAGVIANALHRSSPQVRRGRLLRLEAEQRKHEKSREEYAARFAAWLKVSALEGADSCVVQTEEGIGCKADCPAAVRLAYALANSGGCWGEYSHPRTGRKSSLYSLLTDAADPITAREAATLWLDGCTDPNSPDSYSARWSAHFTLRVEYEKAMLANEGGMAAEVEMIPGGWVGSHQIQSVNRSAVTGRVVSVKVWGTTSGYTRESGYKESATWRELVTLNIERFGENVYRAPTAEELAEFIAKQKAEKAAAKASKPAAPSLVNPSDADAERLQKILNDRARAKYERKPNSKYLRDFEPSAVLRMTQAEYSERSKGTYSRFETREVHGEGYVSKCASSMLETENGQEYAKRIGPAVCKVRMRSGGGWDNAPFVVVLTDKPQKDLPAAVWESLAVDASPGAAADAAADAAVELEASAVVS